MISPGRHAIPIDDADDPRIAAYRDIRERDLAGRQGRFVAEGKVVLDVLFSAGALRGRIGADPRFAGWPDWRRRWPRRRPPCRSMSPSRAVMDAVAGFPMHRGVLAIGRRRDDDSRDALAGRPARRALVARAGRHLQPRQYGRDLPQRRRLRRRCRAARRNLLRPALPQGDPRLGRRGAENSVRLSPARTTAWHRRRSTAHGFGQFALSPRGEADIRDVERRERWRSISAPKATACRPTCWRGCRRCAFRSPKVSTASTSPPPRRSRCTRSGTGSEVAGEVVRLNGMAAARCRAQLLFTIHYSLFTAHSPRRRCLLQGAHAVGEAGDLLMRPVGGRPRPAPPRAPC